MRKQVPYFHPAVVAADPYSEQLLSETRLAALEEIQLSLPLSPCLYESLEAEYSVRKWHQLHALFGVPIPEREELIFIKLRYRNSNNTRTHIF